jgi:mRNA-degrading endonuclease RelE of RelBE toxin-antitoxin system
VLEALDRFAAGEAVDVRTLAGTEPPAHRLRVGGWRVLLRLDGATATATVARVGRRGQVYRRSG